MDHILTSRRSTLFGLTAIAATSCAPKTNSQISSGPSIAISVDDFNIKDGPLLTALEKDQKFLNAFRAHGIRAGAFPAGKYAKTESAKNALTDWAEAGHIIGNHSYDHPYYGGKNPDGMMQEFLKADAILSTYSTYEKWIRFPYLAEGKTAEGRDALRDLLFQNGFRNAHVTIDASDWYINGRLTKRLREDPKTDITAYRDYYLEHIWNRAAYYNTLAIDVMGRSDVPHVLLVHHNLATALFLDDVLTMFKLRGWTLADIDTTYTDPLFTLAPNSIPAGQSLIWALAKADGNYEDRLRYPAEDGRYEEAPMDAIGL